jgi:hypothetical protein
MVKSIKGIAASVAVVALAAAGQAGAACMSLDTMMHKMAGPAAGAQLVPAVYRPDTGFGALLPVSTGEDEAAIVGLWQFRTTGFSVDWGTQSWHADGTELMFSGGQNPETGDVCQGVWRKVGANTYTLNHIAMGWMAPGGPFGIRVHFHMVVHLDNTGQRFSGTYKAAVYAVSPSDPFDESVEVASGTGAVSASRVHPD